MNRENEEVRFSVPSVGGCTQCQWFYDASFSDDMWPQQRNSIEARMSADLTREPRSTKMSGNVGPVEDS